MRPRRCAALLGALVFALAAVPRPAAAVGPAVGQDLVIATAAGPRHAILVPPGPGPHPTVVVLHGATISAATTLRGSGFAEAAARRGFTAVFPEGVRRLWNDGRTGGAGGPDDVAFLRALVERLVADHIAAADRVYLAGISNGGMMTLTMACRASAQFAGFGAVIASMPEGVPPCEARPVPLVMVAGTADPMVPYQGGTVGLNGGQAFGGRGQVWGAERTARAFVERDGCGEPTTAALPHRDPADRTHVERIAWLGCRDGTSVTLYRIAEGGHQVAGTRAFLPRILGASSSDIAAAEVILAVFAP
jgi:polyhydroxybutyrate depolymerase